MPGQQTMRFRLGVPVIVTAFVPVQVATDGSTTLRYGGLAVVGEPNKVGSVHLARFAQHEYHASQVPPEWHAWLGHIRKEPPTEDPVMQNLSPVWKSVRRTTIPSVYLSGFCISP